MVFFVMLYTIIEANLNYFYKFYYKLLKKLELFSKTPNYFIKMNKKHIIRHYGIT